MSLQPGGFYYVVAQHYFTESLPEKHLVKKMYNIWTKDFGKVRTTATENVQKPASISQAVHATEISKKSSTSFVDEINKYSVMETQLQPPLTCPVAMVADVSADHSKTDDTYKFFVSRLDHSETCPTPNNLIRSKTPAKKKVIVSPRNVINLRKEKKRNVRLKDFIVTPYLKSKKRNKTPSVKEVLYCLCRQPDDGRDYVFCDNCLDWFHTECVGMTYSKALEIPEFYCPPCVEALEECSTKISDDELPEAPSPLGYSFAPSACEERSMNDERDVEEETKEIKKDIYRNDMISDGELPEAPSPLGYSLAPSACEERSMNDERDIEEETKEIKKDIYKNDVVELISDDELPKAPSPLGYSLAPSACEERSTNDERDVEENNKETTKDVFKNDVVEQTTFSKDTIDCIIGEKGKIDDGIFKASLPRKVHFCLSLGEWEKLTPTVNKSGRKRFPVAWTEIFIRHIKKTNPYCCFSFTENRIKAFNSRKRSAPYFRGKAVCRHPGCSVQVNVRIDSSGESKRRVTVCYINNVNHDISYISARQVKGDLRKKVREKLENVCPSKYHHSQLNALQSDVYASGNRDSSTTNVGVLRKVKSEITKSNCDNREVILSVLHQKVKMATQTTTSFPILAKNVPGYIQRFSPIPLQVFLWTETSIRMYNDFAIKTKLFFDATGLKVKKLSYDTGGRILYYSLVLQHPVSGEPPVAVAELISSEHDVDSISFFLSKFLRDVQLTCNSIGLMYNMPQFYKRWKDLTKSAEILI